MLRTSILIRMLLALLALTVIGIAHQRGEEPGSDPARMERMRERWSSLSDADRQRLRERWQRFQQLAPEERGAMIDKARALEMLQKRIEQNLNPQQRQRWESLPDQRKRELMREMFQGIGSRMRERLPTEMVERMRDASPEQRKQLYLEAKKSLIENFVRERGLPEGMSAERWSQMQAMDPQNFLEASREHFQSRGERGGQDRRREGWGSGGIRREGSHAEGGKSNEGGRQGEAGKPNEGGRAGEGARRSGYRNEEEHQRMHRIRDAWHAQPGDIIDFADLEPAARAAQVRARIHERVVQKLAEEGIVTAEEAVRLRGLNPDELEQELRKRGSGGFDRRGGSRRGPSER